MTPEQAWCGVWWDCCGGECRCTNSILEPSPALAALSGADATCEYRALTEAAAASEVKP